MDLKIDNRSAFWFLCKRRNQ